MPKHDPVAPQQHSLVGDAKDEEPIASQNANTVERDQAIRIKNRRKIYLDRHPSYFESHELELADPLLYDRCIRRFQSAAEREAEGRSKGYSGVLESDLYRSEAKLAALMNHGLPSGDFVNPSSYHITYVRGPHGEILPEDPDEIPANREEGMKIWRHEMTMRFLKGEDNDFNYEEVDENDDWDVIEDRDAEDRWFDDEEPQWMDNDYVCQGDTGIQDF